MASSDDDLLMASAALLIMNSLLKKKEQKKRRHRRWWMTSAFKSRITYSGSNLLEDLRREDSGHFSNFCRMPPATFDVLLEMITHMIKKEDTNFRKAIPPQERLALTLHFLATGNSFSSLAMTFKISKQTISTVVPEVCEAIIQVLQDQIKMPDTEENWLKIADEYEKQWNFPHCVGSIDGKYVQIQAPATSGSNFFNYKSTFSIVLMALVDADYNFLYADVGCEGRISDGGVFRNTSLFQKLDKNELNLPTASVLEGRQKLVPYVFVADDAFPLKYNIMKPYSGLQQKGSRERSYNYRLSRARRVVENVFGILSAIFRVLRRPLLLEPDKAERVVMTCVYLHNFLRKNKISKNIYTPNGTFDSEINGEIREGTWRNTCQGETSSFVSFQRVGRRSAKSVEEIRTDFAEYFVTNGKLQWQNEYE